MRKNLKNKVESNRLFHHFGVDRSTVIPRDFSAGDKAKVAIKVAGGGVILRHFQGHPYRAFVLHLFFGGLHEERAQTVAARDGIHIEGYDVPSRTPAKAGALNDDKANQPVVGLLSDPAGRAGVG